MARYWDKSMRTLVQINPQAFVDFVLPGALYVRKQPEKLRSWQLEVDALLQVTINRQPALIHLEFQTYHDTDMPERLLRYNILARSEYKLPVLSSVIYLLKDGSVASSPLCWTVPVLTEQGEQEMLRFSYSVIEIGNMLPEDIICLKQPALLPFMPLTKGGATREVVLRMFEALKPAHDKSLDLVGFTLATLVFRKSNELDWEWLQRRFENMHDILRESPFFQQILSEGREEGKTEGLQIARKIIIGVIRARFPAIVQFAEEQVAKISDPNLLQSLGVKIATVQNAEEAMQDLVEACKKNSSTTKAD